MTSTSPLWGQGSLGPRINLCMRSNTLLQLTLSEICYRQALVVSLLIAVKRGSYDIYKSLVGTGVIGPPDKLMYEEQYLTSVDIVRDLLQVRYCVSTNS